MENHIEFHGSYVGFKLIITINNHCKVDVMYNFLSHTIDHIYCIIFFHNQMF